eukprot:scaffold4521_cov76-Isochrysis_galbana.AAC.3
MFEPGFDHQGGQGGDEGKGGSGSGECVGGKVCTNWVIAHEPPPILGPSLPRDAPCPGTCPLLPINRSLTKNSTSRMVMRRTSSRKGAWVSTACTPAGLPSRSVVSAELSDSCSNAVSRGGDGGANSGLWHEPARHFAHPLDVQRRVLAIGRVQHQPLERGHPLAEQRRSRRAVVHADVQHSRGVAQRQRQLLTPVVLWRRVRVATLTHPATLALPAGVFFLGQCGLAGLFPAARPARSALDGPCCVSLGPPYTQHHAGVAGALAGQEIGAAGAETDGRADVDGEEVGEGCVLAQLVLDLEQGWGWGGA